jgi:hypothetical protein
LGEESGDGRGTPQRLTPDAEDVLVRDAREAVPNVGPDDNLLAEVGYGVGPRGSPGNPSVEIVRKAERAKEARLDAVLEGPQGAYRVVNPTDFGSRPFREGAIIPPCACRDILEGFPSDAQAETKVPDGPKA